MRQWKKGFVAFCGFFLLCFVFAGRISGNAQETPAPSANGIQPEPVRYSLQDSGLGIVLSGDLAVVTGNEIRNRPILDMARLDPQNLRRFMRENSVELYALDRNLNQEILLVFYPSESRDYNLLTDEELESIITSREMRQALDTLGTAASVYAPYRSETAAWIVIDVQQVAADQILYAAEYYTVVNGKAISLVLQNSSGPVNADQYALIKSLADSITFTPR